MTDNGVGIRDLIRMARKHQAGARDRHLESYRQYLKLPAHTSINASLQGKAGPSDWVQETFLKAHQLFTQFRGRALKRLRPLIERQL